MQHCQQNVKKCSSTFVSQILKQLAGNKLLYNIASRNDPQRLTGPTAFTRK